MKYKRVNTHMEIEAFIRAATHIAIDLETTGLDPWKDQILDVVLANSKEESILFHPQFLSSLNIISDPIFHNAKFDLTFLYRNGVDLTKCDAYDTIIAHHLHNENLSHKLDDIVQSRWGDDYKAKFWSRFKTYAEADEDSKLEYACKDAIYTMRLYQELVKEQDFNARLFLSTNRLNIALLSTELSGINVDLTYLAKLKQEYSGKIDTLKEDLRLCVRNNIESLEMDYWMREIDKRVTPKGKQAVIKPSFNFSSSKQLSDLLYLKLKLPAQKNKAGNLTTDEGALTKLSGKHPVVDKLLDLRGLEKVLGTYLLGIEEKQRDGKIYPSFNVCGTVTGRISSSNPNMHQLPRAGSIRGIYVPSLGHKIITADYGMVEVVIAAHYSQDPNLLKIIRDGASKHDITAAALKIDRQTAKTLNFALQYQCSPWKVSKIIGCSPADGQYYWNKYWETYKEEKRIIDDCKEVVIAGNPVYNMYGRKRTFPLNFDMQWKLDEACRQAYSFLIQGTAADLMHSAYVMIYDRLRECGYGRTLLEIHDEVVAEAADSRIGQVEDILETCMLKAGKDIQLSLPLTVDISEPKTRWEK